MNKIQILGIGCKKHRALEANLKAALQYLSLSLSIEQVTGVDEIVDYHISSIPALLVDGTPVFQGVVPTVEEIKCQLEKIISSAAA
jgi:small redox-active disulfide protein 2